MSVGGIITQPYTNIRSVVVYECLEISMFAQVLVDPHDNYIIIIILMEYTKDGTVSSDAFRFS